MRRPAAKGRKQTDLSASSAHNCDSRWKSAAKPANAGLFQCDSGFSFGKMVQLISTVKLQCNIAKMGAKDRWHHVKHHCIMIYHKVSLLSSCLSVIISSQNGTVSETWHQAQNGAFIFLALVRNDIFQAQERDFQTTSSLFLATIKWLLCTQLASSHTSNGVDVWAQTDSRLHRFSRRRPQRTPSLLLPSNKTRNQQRTRCSPA